MTTAVDIGRSIRDARRRRGLRQEDVALASGVGLRFIHELENGKSSVELGLTLRVIEAVGLDVRVDDRQLP
jgi:HTH-type transcriptional regulator / antitoxin HipB